MWTEIVIVIIGLMTVAYQTQMGSFSLSELYVCGTIYQQNQNILVACCS